MAVLCPHCTRAMRELNRLGRLRLYWCNACQAVREVLS